MAADALFGLPRKKSSGESFEGPKHKDRFFLQQCEVDAFVEQANPQPEVGTIIDSLKVDHIKGMKPYMCVDKMKKLFCFIIHDCLM